MSDAFRRSPEDRLIAEARELAEWVRTLRLIVGREERPPREAEERALSRLRPSAGWPVPYDDATGELLSSTVARVRRAADSIGRLKRETRALIRRL